MNDIAAKIAKLQAKAETLQTQLRATQSRIAALQKKQREQEQGELLQLLKASNLTTEQLRAILQNRAPVRPAQPAEIGETE